MYVKAKFKFYTGKDLESEGGFVSSCSFNLIICTLRFGGFEKWPYGRVVMSVCNRLPKMYSGIGYPLWFGSIQSPVSLLYRCDR